MEAEIEASQMSESEKLAHPKKEEAPVDPAPLLGYFGHHAIRNSAALVLCHDESLGGFGLVDRLQQPPHLTCIHDALLSWVVQVNRQSPQLCCATREANIRSSVSYW